MQRSIYLIICSVLPLLNSCISDGSGGVENYVQVGDVIPEFVITDDNGERFDSSMLLGKKTVLMFFNTGCSDCEREMPVVEEAWRTLKSDPDITFATIARGQTAKDTYAYWQIHQLTLPKYHDPNATAFGLFANSYVPRLYIINRERVIHWMVIETFNMTANELVEKVRALN